MGLAISSRRFQHDVAVICGQDFEELMHSDLAIAVSINALCWLLWAGSSVLTSNTSGGIADLPLGLNSTGGLSVVNFA